MPTFTVQQAKALISAMDQHVTAARLLDQQEWNSAKAAIEGCSVQKREISQSTVDQIFAYPVERITELSTKWLDVYGPGLLAEDQVTDRSGEWQDRDTALGQLQDRINGLDMSKWQGSGADNYRARIAEVTTYVSQQRELATTATADLAKVHGHMVKVNSEYRSAMTAGHANVNACALPSANTTWPKADWWQINKNAEQYSFTFFTRTAAVSDKLYDLCTSLAKLQSTVQPLDASGMPTATATTHLGGPQPPKGPLGYCMAPPPENEAPAAGYE